MTEDEVLTETLCEGVAQIRINRPERMNALSFDCSLRLREVLQGVISAKARVLLIRGQGRGFCAGADLKERRTMDAQKRAEHNRVINEFINDLANAPMPTVAVINGAALGGGCEIALACDMRIAAEEATIGLTETRIGVIPGAGGTQRLPRVIGCALALELMMTGEPVSGARAAQIGLVNHVVPLAQLDTRALELAKVLAARSPLGLREVKSLVYAGLSLPLREGLLRERESLVRVLVSDDYAEGLAAFAERRAPRFTGR